MKKIMGKKALSLIVCITLSTSIFGTTISSAAQIPEQQYTSKITGELVSEQEFQEELYNEHLAQRPKTANLTDKQKDYLRAMGISDQELAVITNGDVADILKTGQVVEPAYIKKYIDTEALEYGAILAEEENDEILSSWGLTDEEIELFKDENLNMEDFEDKSLSDIQNALSDNLMYQIQSTSVDHSTCHLFDGSRASSLLSGDVPNYFFSSAFPLYATNSYGESVYLGYHPSEGTEEYELKCDHLEGNLNDALSAYRSLFHNYSSSVSALRYNQFLYGEEYYTTYTFHEGVDFNNTSNTLYSIMAGDVILKYQNNSYYGVSSPINSSVIGVYDSAFDVTLLYVHLNINSSILNGTVTSVTKQTNIGTESKYGTTDEHTHLQIQDGAVTSRYDVYGQDDEVEALKPYAYFWFWCDYQD